MHPILGIVWNLQWRQQLGAAITQNGKPLVFFSVRSSAVFSRSTVWFGFGISKAVNPHFDPEFCFSTPISTSCLIFFLKTVIQIYWTENGLPLYGFAPNCMLNLGGSVWKSPRVLSHSSLFFYNKASNSACCKIFRWLQLLFTIVGRSVIAYFASIVSAAL